MHCLTSQNHVWLQCSGSLRHGTAFADIRRRSTVAIISSLRGARASVDVDSRGI